MFLTESGYKIPIRNMDELLDSGIGLAYLEFYNPIFEERDRTESLKFQRNRVDCPLFDVCFAWAKYHKNVSFILMDKIAEENYAVGSYLGENSEPLVCPLDDGVVFSFGQSMIMFHGDPLMRRFNVIINHVIEAGLHNYWETIQMNVYKNYYRKIAIPHPLDGYYSFNLYHMHPAFYLLLLGWCLSAFCFMVEVLYNRVL